MFNPMIRSKLLVALLFGALIAFAAGVSPASAQDYGGGTETTAPAPGGTGETITVVRGDTTDVNGTGCAPGSSVGVTYDDGSDLGTFTADDNGDFVTTITIPASSSVGAHTATATCGDVQQFIDLNVLAAQANNPGGNNGSGSNGVSNGTLARTGSSNTGPLVGIGAAAVVLGAAFVYGARRPRSA